MALRTLFLLLICPPSHSGSCQTINSRLPPNHGPQKARINRTQASDTISEGQISRKAPAPCFYDEIEACTHIILASLLFNTLRFVLSLATNRVLFYLYKREAWLGQV